MSPPATIKSGAPAGRAVPMADGARVDKSGDKVRGMFAEIAPRYDLVNRILSGGTDLWWRHVTVRRAPPPLGGAILDVCTGTGDLAIAYADRAAAPAAGQGLTTRIVASDFCRPMLDRGREKAAARHPQIEWVEADAMALPFPAADFDLVTVAFGLRNIADTSRGLAEMARVCRPGGTLAILEFSLPSNPIVRSGYLWYFRNVLPRLGNAVARNASDAYTYLNQSVEDFPSGRRLAALVEAAGFADVEQVPLSFGIATLTVATRTTSPAGSAAVMKDG